MGLKNNPFEVTKATDYTDKEIESNFVSFAISGATALASPSDPMPIFLVGGKGGGRTHLMRHFAFAQQRMRAESDGRKVLEQLKLEGYLGIYVRFTGLNANRFSGKGTSDEAWSSIFSYYVDLWLAQSLLIAIHSIQSGEAAWCTNELTSFVDSFEAGFDLRKPSGLLDFTSDQGPVDGLLDLVTEELRGFDQAMNRAALTRDLDVEIRSSPGQIVFAAARAVAALTGAENLRISFMLDEFENLTETQQVYVNTLIRDKELPTSFLVGSRRWGIKTRRTQSAGEENKVGSEYSQIVLEDTYRERKSEYQRFCRDIVLKRIGQIADSVSAEDRVKRWFGEPEHSKAKAAEVAEYYMQRFEPQNRPHLAKLRKQVADKSLAIAITEKLSIPESPILEKLAVREFYGEWRKRGKPELEDAVSLGKAFKHFAAGGDNVRLSSLENHWRADMLAQLIESTRADQVYAGFDQYVQMSGYLPRNLLVLVKNITAWAIRYGEDPFGGDVKPISRRAMISGVREASKWFLSDATPMGQLGVHCDLAVNRLGSLFRSQRYSDRPSEVSCSAFSFSPSETSQQALRVLQACVEHGLLLELTDGQRERNTAERLPLYQLNPMLAPIFDLASSRRGTMLLDSKEFNALFDPASSQETYRVTVSAKLSGFSVPFGRPDVEVSESFASPLF